MVNDHESGVIIPEKIEISKAFDNLKQDITKLKFICVDSSITGRETCVVHFSIAGAKSKYPGSINVTNGGRYPKSVYYGRIMPEGTGRSMFHSSTRTTLDVCKVIEQWEEFFEKVVS